VGTSFVGQHNIKISAAFSINMIENKFYGFAELCQYGSVDNSMVGRILLNAKVSATRGGRPGLQ